MMPRLNVTAQSNATFPPVELLCNVKLASDLERHRAPSSSPPLLLIKLLAKHLSIMLMSCRLCKLHSHIIQAVADTTSSAGRTSNEDSSNLEIWKKTKAMGLFRASRDTFTDVFLLDFSPLLFHPRPSNTVMTRSNHPQYFFLTHSENLAAHTASQIGFPRTFILLTSWYI